MRFIGSILLLISSLFSAEAYLSNSSIVAGDRIVLILKAEGQNIKFPDISSVGGFKVVSTGMQQNVEYINGNMRKSIEKHYAFMPLSSVDIGPYEIEVNGKKEYTKPLHVEVKKADTTNSPFILEMKISKQNVMQFEAVPVEFVFKRDAKYEVRDLRFTPPMFENFWVKEGKKEKPFLENGFVVHKMNFIIFPQKSGDFDIKPAKVDVGVMSKNRDIFNMLTNQLNWKSVISNAASLHVKKLEGATLYGDYSISLGVDKNEIEGNEGVNVTLKISGNGNFDDIDEYKIQIDGANIYSDKPVVKSEPTTKGMKGEFIQKFSISSKTDFTIPSLSITYYDSNSKKVVTKSTKPILIKVKKSTKEQPVQISSNEPKEKIVYKEKYNSLYVVLAFILGVLITLFVMFLMRKKDYRLPKFKDDRDHLKTLLKRRGESEEIDKKIIELENKLYKREL